MVVWPTFSFKNQTSDCPGEKHLGNHRLTVQKVAGEVEISVGAFHTILMKDRNELAVSKIYARLMSSQISSKKK
jgi:hypothetical protein